MHSRREGGKEWRREGNIKKGKKREEDAERRDKEGSKGKREGGRI